MIKFFGVINLRCIFAVVKNRTSRMNIRIIVIALTAMLALASCSSEYQIKGSSSVPLLDGKMLFIKVPDGMQMVKVDSAEVIHGFFQMEGEIDTTVIGSLYMDEQSIMPLVVEKGNIQIKIDNARFLATGTPLNDKLYEFVGKKNSLEDRAYEVERMESRMIMEGISVDEVEKKILQEREVIVKEQDALVKDFITENYENVLGPGVFVMLCNSLPYPVVTPLIEEIMENAPVSFKENLLVKEYMEVARKNMESMNAQK